MFLAEAEVSSNIMDTSILLDNYFLHNALITLVFGALFLVLKHVGIRFIRSSNKPWTAEQRLRWIGYFRTVFFGVLILGILYIWGEQLHSFAVSIFAIAFALVFSIKELCMCLNGSLMRLRGNVYNLGDRIEIKNYRGDVIDFNLLTTTILEIGPGSNSHHTGRIITFPNSLFVGDVVINESFVDYYFMHNITFPLELTGDWQKAKMLLLKIAQEECSPFLEQIRRRMKEISRQKGIQLPSVEPRVTVQVPEVNQIRLILRVPAPIHLKGRMEQTILTKFLEQFCEKEEKSSEEDALDSSNI